MRFSIHDPASFKVITLIFLLPFFNITRVSLIRSISLESANECRAAYPLMNALFAHSVKSFDLSMPCESVVHCCGIADLFTSLQSFRIHSYTSYKLNQLNPSA